MKRLFSSPDTAEVGLLKNILLKAGILCVEMDEQMAQTIPSSLFQAELWVADANYSSAATLLAEWQNPTAAGTPWVCSRCGEKLESQFSKCWKCGTRRDAAATI
jgi:hypothetical protein